ncbi:MAG: glutathione synthase [Myxococcales bacterium]|nr:glutathione synthase [Myxococcales bacterium]
MRILVVMDPIEAVRVDKDTTFGFLLAAQRRGHQMFYCNIHDLFARGGEGAARAAPIEVQAKQGEHFALGDWADYRLADFDSIWNRKDPPVDRAYLHATHILDLAGPKTLVVNSTDGVRMANEKVYALHFSQWMPETLVTRDVARIRGWLREGQQPLIVKPIDGHGGAGIFLLRPDDRNVASILETLSGEGQHWVMAQQYLPAAREGDKRIILIDGEARGAILRVPQADENRGNIHVGGRVVHSELTPREKALCAAIGPRLRADGLWFVGLDVIGEHLTEINVTSPTGIREVEALTGVDLGDEYVRFVEGRLAGT